MNAFSAALDATGYTFDEAAEYLGVRYDSVQHWYSGRRACPTGVLADIAGLVGAQRVALQELAKRAADGPVAIPELPLSPSLMAGLALVDRMVQGHGVKLAFVSCEHKSQ